MKLGTYLELGKLMRYGMEYPTLRYLSCAHARTKSLNNASTMSWLVAYFLLPGILEVQPDCYLIWSRQSSLKSIVCGRKKGTSTYLLAVPLI